MTEGLGTGVVNAGEVGPGATETETAESSQATESVASENGTEQASVEQSQAEGGSAEEQRSRQRGPSKLDTIRELRSKLRDQRSYWESEIGGLRQQIEELKNGLQSGRSEKKPSKTFWEAPEEVMDERFDSKLSAMEKRLLEQLNSRETQNQQTAEWQSETSEATKFIQTQKGITPEDEEDIAELVRSTPEMQNLRPLQRAKYALYLWREQRGITDKSEAKARSATVIGAGGTQSGPKTWTESEMEAEISKLPPDPKSWTDEQKKRFDFLDNEFKRAFNEGRVKK